MHPGVAVTIGNIEVAVGPMVSRQSIADSALRGVVDRFFDGVSTRAVAHLLGAPEEVDEAELRRLESSVRAKRKAKR